MKRPKNLKEEHVETIKRSNERHSFFTFDGMHPFYYIIPNVFKDAKKGELVYFDEENKKLEKIQLGPKEKKNTKNVQKWIKKYHEAIEAHEQEKKKRAEERRAEKNSSGNSKSTVQKKRGRPAKNTSSSKNNGSSNKKGAA